VGALHAVKAFKDEEPLIVPKEADGDDADKGWFGDWCRGHCLSLSVVFLLFLFCLFLDNWQITFLDFSA
jgi:hypothetical protein